MNNTNFQTFHQMGNAINDFVKQATGRDNVQNIDIDHVTVAQNHYYEDVDVSGPIASFMASAVVPLDSCVVNIQPIQSGSGDPSPDNVRPIMGWTGAKVSRTGKNLFGGEFMANTIVNVVNNELKAYKGEDNNGKYVTIVPGGAMNRKVILKDCFKTDTQYTVLLRAKKSNTTNQANLAIVYTNGNITNVVIAKSPNITADTIYTYAVHSNANATIEYIMLSWQSGDTTIYYDDFGIFEGILTADQFEPYQGQTYDISWESEAGTVYGGTLDVTTGTLVVDRAMVTFDGTQAVGFSEGTSTNRIAWNAYVTEGAIGTAFISNLLKSSEPASSIKSDPWLIYNGNGVPRMFMTVPKNIASIEDFNAYAEQNNINVVYYLAEPLTYQLTPVEITTLLGQNNIWADTGDIEVKSRVLKELY